MEKANNSIKRRTTGKKMSFGKYLIKCNPIDPLSNISRKVMKRFGVLDIFDDFIYWNVGRTNFIKLFKTYWKYPIRGKENFPEYGGALVIANHQSELDPFLVGSAVHRKVQWLSKAENFQIPIFKSFIKPFGTIPLKRGQRDEEAMQNVRNVLENGGCVGMFPEGTRSSDGSLGEFRSGAARLVLESGVPYVPCAVIGAYKVFPKHKGPSSIKWKGGYEISIVIGKPVYADPSLEANYENAQLIKNAMRNDILKLQSGEMNESRTISKREKVPASLAISTQQKTKKRAKIPKSIMDPGFNPAEDLSIS
ncbi:lysophospholipid acyltransferase family protein [Candidatus Lokiarchaeum ossiferum]